MPLFWPTFGGTWTVLKSNIFLQDSSSEDESDRDRIMADQQEVMLQKLQEQHHQLEQMLKSHEDKMAAHKAASDTRRNGTTDMKVQRRPHTLPHTSSR